MSLMSRFKAWLAYHGERGEGQKETKMLADTISSQMSIITSLKQQNQILKEENEHLRGQVLEYHARLRSITKKLIIALED